MKLYEIEADYRPLNASTPKYYVKAENIKEAKERFNEFMGHLKVYSCKEVEDKVRMLKILNSSYKYTVFGHRALAGVEVTISEELIENKKRLMNDTVLRVLDEHEKEYGKEVPIEIKIRRR